MKTRRIMNRWLVLTFKAILYILIYTVVYAMLSGVQPGWRAFISYGITITFILTISEPLTAKIQHFIDANFYRSLYRFRKLLEQFNRDLNTLKDYKALQKQTLNFLNRLFASDFYYFYLYWEVTFEMLNPRNPHGLPEMITDGETIQDCLLFQQPAQLFPVKTVLESNTACAPLAEALRRVPEHAFVVGLKGNQEIQGFLILPPEVRHKTEFPDVDRLLRKVLAKLATGLENARVYSEIKRKSLESALLFEISKKITSSLNLQDVLNTIIDSVGQLVSYDAAAIFLIDKEAQILRHMATRGYNVSLLDRMPLKLHQGIAGHVVRTRKPSIIADVGKEPAYYSLRKETRSQITVPIFAGEEVVGVLVLESDYPNHFTQADLELLTSFANMAGIAITNAQLYEDSLKKKKLESDLLVASRVQRALLPSRPPRVRGAEIEVFTIPSLIVGGDLYDIFRFGERGVGLAIGDVSGKGAPGAILMALVYAGFKSLLKEIWEVSEIMARLNNLLAESTTEGYFSTFFFSVYQEESRKLTYCNAGHNPPIVLHPDRSIEYLTEGGTVLGFLPNQEYVQKTITLQPGDYLVMYTDGVTEIRNAKGEEFGEERLEELLKTNYGKSPKELKNEIITQIRRFSGKMVFEDDVTLLIMQLTEDA